MLIFEKNRIVTMESPLSEDVTLRPLYIFHYTSSEKH